MNKRILAMFNYLIPYWKYRQVRESLEEIHYSNQYYYQQYGYYCNLYRLVK